MPRDSEKMAADEVLVSLRQVEVAGRVNLDHLKVHDGARLLVTGPNGAGNTRV
jgi:macrolide transport system ATP-binding/permease protein